jgi:L-erythro-3,5-diaminohexanoate dehydrogenase
VVVVIGAGKAGLLCLAEAMDRVFPHGRVVCLEYEKAACDRVRELRLAHNVIQADATAPLETLERFQAVMGDNLADFTVNCVNVGGTEVTSALVTRNRGQIYFFSMSTNFAKAALGVEGIKKETRMIIGNGYYPGHDQITFQIIRNHPGLYQCLESFFVR